MKVWLVLVWWLFVAGLALRGLRELLLPYFDEDWIYMLGVGAVVFSIWLYLWSKNQGLYEERT